MNESFEQPYSLQNRFSEQWYRHHQQNKAIDDENGFFKNTIQTKLRYEHKLQIVEVVYATHCSMLKVCIRLLRVIVCLLKSDTISLSCVHPDEYAVQKELSHINLVNRQQCPIRVSRSLCLTCFRQINKKIKRPLITGISYEQTITSQIKLSQLPWVKPNCGCTHVIDRRH